jgi:uncharacterized DUF497 family protein
MECPKECHEPTQARCIVRGAASVFYDPLSATGDDPDHSADERRFVTFGVSSSGRLLVVAHADRDDVIRIISARPAARADRKIYEG